MSPNNACTRRLSCRTLYKNPKYAIEATQGLAQGEKAAMELFSRALYRNIRKTAHILHTKNYVLYRII